MNKAARESAHDRENTSMSLLNNVLMGSQAAGMFGRGMGGAGLGRGMGLGAGRGVSPLTLALLGTLAYRTMKGKGRLADMLGTSRPSAPQQPGANPAQASQAGNPAALPGDLLSPGALSEGLSRLINRFRLNGHGAEAESWVAKGANEPIDPPALEEALGDERIAWLMEQTGMSKQELLEGLSKTLPGAVDQLTPDGKIPSEQEARRLMQ
jgi:uncharacterized protein YidB (DUF937 family)